MCEWLLIYFEFPENLLQTWFVPDCAMKTRQHHVCSQCCQPVWHWKKLPWCATKIAARQFAISGRGIVWCFGCICLKMCNCLVHTIWHTCNTRSDAVNPTCLPGHRKFWDALCGIWSFILFWQTKVQCYFFVVPQLLLGAPAQVPKYAYQNRSCHQTFAMQLLTPTWYGQLCLNFGVEVFLIRSCK